MTVTFADATAPLTRFSATPNGTVIGLAFVVCANAACLVGAAGLVTEAFVGGAVLVAVLLARLRPLAALEFALWLWVLGPQVRRMVDLSVGFAEPSLVLLAAPLASLAATPSIGRLRHSQLRRAVRPLLVVGAATASGYVVGIVTVGLQPATATMLVWLVPVIFGLQVVALGDDLHELRQMVSRFLIWSTLVVGVYGIVQFYAVPAWDAYWMRNVEMNSIGLPEPFAVRVFSTLNSPAPLGAFLAAALLYLMGVQHRLRVPALVVGHATLALSLVRSAWIGWLVGTLVVIVAGRPRARATALAVTAIAVLGLLQVSGPLQRVIADRIVETRAGQQDDSFVARVALHEELAPVVATRVVGHGLGAVGSLSRIGDEHAELAVIDSGLLDLGFALGIPAGLTVLATLTFGGLELARRGLREGRVSAGTVAAGLSILVQLVFGSVLIGVSGTTFFVLWALALREGLGRYDDHHGSRRG